MQCARAEICGRAFDGVCHVFYGPEISGAKGHAKFFDPSRRFCQEKVNEVADEFRVFVVLKSTEVIKLRAIKGYGNFRAIHIPCDKGAIGLRRAAFESRLKVLDSNRFS